MYLQSVISLLIRRRISHRNKKSTYFLVFGRFLCLLTTSPASKSSLAFTVMAFFNCQWFSHIFSRNFLSLQKQPHTYNCNMFLVWEEIAIHLDYFVPSFSKERSLLLLAFLLWRPGLEGCCRNKAYCYFFILLYWF